MTGSTPYPVFRDYAEFYDSLYADKDYVVEVRSLERIFSEHGVDHGASVLDLGCGTGGHVIPLAQAGYRVTGVDRSPEMISIAREKAEIAGVDPALLVGDVRDISLDATFDAVISMFAVVGYQLTNHDLAAMFSVARRHLGVGGVFTFDAWFGPAVLAQKPEVKRKEVALDDGGTLVRVATPTLDVVAQTVRVDYHLVRDRRQGAVEEVEESHTMRFLFAQETAYMLEIAGFEVASLTPFGREGAKPTENDWNVSWVARAI
jgi:SAM-dependent methyltransferase